MKLDHQYLKTIYENNSLQDFLRLVSEEDIDDPRLRAIVSTLRRSVRNIHLEFNPIFSNSPEENTQESNPLQ
jgi:hypothetical protein